MTSRIPQRIGAAFNEVAGLLMGPLLARARPGNAVMFHLGRSGSTVLGRMLGQHRRIFWRGELYDPIFRQWRRENNGIECVRTMPEDPALILRRDMRLAFHRVYGFEMKPFHFGLIGRSLDAMFSEFDALGFTHFILLERRNRLRKIVSSLVAHESGTYHLSTTESARLRPVHVNIEEIQIDFASKPLIDFLTDYDDRMQAITERLAGRRVLSLSYEDDIENDPHLGYQRVCSFLGVKPEPATIDLARMNPFRLRDMVQNWAEVERALTGSKFEWMLGDSQETRIQSPSDGNTG